MKFSHTQIYILKSYLEGLQNMAAFEDAVFKEVKLSENLWWALIPHDLCPSKKKPGCRCVKRAAM